MSIDFTEQAIKEEELDKQYMEQHTNLDSEVQIPLYPWVLIRVLPRDIMASDTIYMPEVSKTNRVIHEGIVLRTWKPRTVKVHTVPVWNDLKKLIAKVAHRELPSVFDKELERDKMEWMGMLTCTKTTILESGVKMGDHVLFPHWAGAPAGKHFDKRYYRFIPEYSMGRQDNGEMMAVVRHPEHDVKTRMMNLLKPHLTALDMPCGQLVDELMNEFDIVEKVRYPSLMPSQAKE